jgi:hypothetical protein
VEGKGKEPNRTEPNDASLTRSGGSEKFDSNDLERLFSEMRKGIGKGSYRLKHTDYDRAQKAIDWAREECADDPAAACSIGIGRYLAHANGKMRDEGYPFWGWAQDPARWFAFDPNARSGDGKRGGSAPVSETYSEEGNPSWAK